jgi:hypothetical protein
MNKGKFDDVFRYELDDESRRLTYFLLNMLIISTQYVNSQMCLKQRFKS